MEILSTVTELPEGSMAFVFGSVLRNAHPMDFDLLVVYDPSLCPPNIAYRVHAPFFGRLSQKTDLPVDMTLLTYQEEKSSCFILGTKALPIAEALSVDSAKRDQIGP